VEDHDALAALIRRPHRNLTAECAKPSLSGLDLNLDHNLDYDNDLIVQSGATELVNQKYPALLRKQAAELSTNLSHANEADMTH